MTPTFRHRERDRTVDFGRDLLTGLDQLLPAEYDGLFIITTERLAGRLEDLAWRLGSRHAHTHVGARMHVPVPDIEAVVERFDATGARAILAVGGGSAIGLAKGLARRRPVPLAAVPTTYAGSEMTAVWGETTDGVKTTGRDDNVRPSSVVYDVALTETMPLRASVASAFNALAHAMEALYAPDATPISDGLASRAVGELCLAVTGFAESTTPDGARLTGTGARSHALQGAWLAGLVLDSTTMSLHHKLCHLLGGAYDLPHAETHALLLPHVLRTCRESAPGVHETFADALRTPDPSARLAKLYAATGGPTSLSGLGITSAQVDEIIARLVGDDAPDQYNFDPSLAAEVVRRAWPDWREGS